MENIFKKPTKYIEKLREIQLLDINSNVEFSGKSMAVIFLTKYCNAKCEFCIYKSPNKEYQENNREDEFDKIGIEKCIDFINKSNIGYLLISGGGEPFLKINYLINLIQKVNVKNIVIVSNGFWAKNYKTALKILQKINKLQEKYEKNIIIRISMDKWHYKYLGTKHIKNLIDIFSVNDLKELKLKIHTIINDNTIFNILEEYNYIIKYQTEYSSDNEILNKSNKQRTFVKLNNDYNLEIEFAKLFKPNLEVDLNSNIDEQIEVFMEDLIKSQQCNFSTVTNIDNTKGLDFLINYNGNISTWANYHTYNSPNLYIHDYKAIMNIIYNDIVSYSFLKESFNSIIDIVKEINPIAVHRAIGINIRDFFGMYLLYENKTLLYYYIIILKKYIKERIVVTKELEKIPEDVKIILSYSKEEIIKLYNESNYSIIEQYKESKFLEENWKDLFFLIKRKHFDLNELQITEAIKYYNENTNKKYDNLDEIINNIDIYRYRRLLKRFNL